MSVQLVESTPEPKRDYQQEAREVLEFLNRKARRTYRPVAVNLEFIVARFREGYTMQDAKCVIAIKVREWRDDDLMSKFLRPATLFNRTKFSQYAGEIYDSEDGQ